jgi:hypothetical protein
MFKISEKSEIVESQSWVAVKCDSKNNRVSLAGTE